MCTCSCVCIEQASQKKAEPTLASTSTVAMSASASETSLEQMSACTYSKGESETRRKIEEERARRKKAVGERGEGCSREPSEEGRKERADKETIMMEDNATYTEQSDLQRQDGVLNVEVRADGSTSDEGHERLGGEKSEQTMASDGGGEQATLNVKEQSGEERQKDEAVSMAS